MRLRPLLILCAGFAVFLAYAAPGFLSIDSAQQLLEARSGQYSDWHPPAMAALWREVDHLVSGALGMLLLQSLTFLAGTYLLLRRTFSATRAAVLAIVVLGFPPVLAPMAVIWKDSQMAAYLLLGYALVLDRRRAVRCIGIALLALATAMRDNAAAATLPLLVFGFVWSLDQRWWTRLALSILVWLGITAAATATNRGLTDTHVHAWHTSIAPADIAGVLRFSRSYSDAELLPVLDGTPLIVHDGIRTNARRYYSPISWWRVMNGPNRLFNWPTTELERDSIGRAWRMLVLANPFAYAVHRFHVFREVLGLSASPPFDPVCETRVPGGYGPPLHIDSSPSGIQVSVGAALMWLAGHTFLFRAYGYAALALVLVVLARRKRTVLALVLSGLAYELSLLPFAPSPDVRYSHWLITTTVIAALIVTAERWRAGKSADSREQP